MSNIEKITKMTGQYEKELELAEKHRNKAKEQMEIAEKHAKKAEDLQNQIKYQKGGEVYDRVDALNLTPEELNLLLKLLDSKTQLMDAVQKLFPEKIHNNKDNEEGEEIAVSEENEEVLDGDLESSYFEETPIFGEDENNGKGEENWSA